jgi:hypothetical protein
VTAGGVRGVSLEPRKVGAIAVASQELLDATSDKAMNALARLLRGALVREQDTAFLDPLNGGDFDTPASITFGAAVIPSTGFTADAVKSDMAALVGLMQQAGAPLGSLAFVTSTANALALASLTYASGVPVFPGLGLSGGQIDGAPLVASDSCGPQLVAVLCDYLWATEGPFDAQIDGETSLEMDDDPVGDSGAPTGSPSMISLFQTNSAAVMLLQSVNWMLSWPGAVAVLSDFGPPRALGAREPRR